MKIEVEDKEIALKNSFGDIAIIPKKDVAWVKSKLKDNCFQCIDEYVDTLPMNKDYAEDGTLDPGDGFLKGLWHGIKRSANPKNWGKSDYSQEKDFGSAYSKARSQGEKEFTYKGERYNTKYAGTPAQQLKETGITDEQLQGKSELRRRIAKNITPLGYGHVKSALKAVAKDRLEVPVPDDSLRKYQIFPTEKDELLKDNHYLGRKLLEEAKPPSFTAAADMLNVNMGFPQEHGSLKVSEYRPTYSKEGEKTYYSLTSKNFKKNILDQYLVSTDGVFEKKKKVIMRSKEETDALGNFTVDFGEDDLGTYISIYDKIDYAPLGSYGEQSEKQQKKSVNVGKPIEIYDRIYYKINESSKEKIAKFDSKLVNLGNEIDKLYQDRKKDIDYEPHEDPYLKKINLLNEELYKIATSKEDLLSGIVIINAPTKFEDKILDKSNKEDVIYIQKKLNSLGHKLPNSTKKDGSFDGVWGDETEAALNDWKSKNKN
jgi:hypothetical protein